MWALAAASVVLLSACTASSTVEDDPAGAARDAFEALGTRTAVHLTVSLDGEVADADLAALDLDPAVTPLLTDGRLELWSDAGEAVHVRLVPGADEATQVALARGGANLRATGITAVADALTDGGWIRVTTVPEPAETDAVAGRLADAGTQLLDAASTVRWLGEDDRGDHVRVDAPTTQVRAALTGALAHVLTVDGAGRGDPARPTDAPPGDHGSDRAEVDLWLDAGELVGLRTSLRPLAGLPDGPPLDLDLSVHRDGEGTIGGTDLDRAPAFALRALFVDLLAGPGGGPGDAPTTPPADDGPPPTDDRAEVDDPAEGDPADGHTPPRPRPSEPPQLRPGGVVEEALGDGDVFVDGEAFDCVSDEDLQVLADQLGADAVAEVEELVAAGYLERCPSGQR